MRVYDEQLKQGRFKLGMRLPEGKKELTAIIDVYKDHVYYDVNQTPKVTPPSHLLVNDVLGSYELQPIAATRM